MQQKKTDSVEIEELPEIDDPQLLEFARLLLDGLTASDALRQSHDVSGWLDKSIWAKASTLKSSDKVQGWLKAARMAGLEKGAITHAQYINRLLELSARAEAAGNYGAAVNALTNAGKSAGHMVERIEDMTPVERKTAREKLRDLASKGDLKPITEDIEHRQVH